MSVTVKVLNAKKEVTRKAKVTKKNILVIEAKTNENYQLIDDETGYAPQNIIAKRQGKNLVINLNDGDNNPDIVIKNYYDENGETTNLVVGLHENGKIYAYIPESGSRLEAISVLAEEVAAPQALGGEEIVGGLWVFNPWWLASGAGALAVAALAAGGGGGSGGAGSSNTNKPIEPVLPPTDPKDPSLNAAIEAVKNAEKAGKEMNKIDVGSAVSQADKDKIDSAVKDYQEAKKEAEKLIEKLPEGKEKEQLEKALEALSPDRESPKVNDLNNNEIIDDTERSKAVSALEEAEKAKEKVEDAIRDLGPAYTKEDVEKIKGLIEAYEDKKEDATEAVKQTETFPEHKDYNERLEKLDEIGAPEINDTDGDNFPDGRDKLEVAKEQLDKAKEAEKAMKDRDIGEGTSPKDVKDVTKDVENYEKAKEKAKELIDALESSADKDELTKKWEELGKSRDIPKMNDANDNEIPDNFDEAIAALEKAKDAEKAMNDIALGGAVSPKDAKDIADAVDAYNKAKENAKKLIDNLPDVGKTDELKDGLGSLGDARQVPGVNDVNNNEIDDTQDNATADAALTKAEEAKRDLETAINGKGPGYTTEEVAELAGLKQAYDDAKAEATTAVNAAKAKANDANATDIAQYDPDLKDRLDALTDVKVPAVNDTNKNGHADTDDVQAVRDAINTLTQKQNAWNDAVTAAKRGINTIDHQTLTTKATEFNDALREANTALGRVNGLAQKAGLESEIRNFGGNKTAPAVNDTNPQNDIPDTVDNARAKLEEAKRAKTALEEAKRTNTEPYSTAEATAINAKVNAFNTALQNAKTAVTAAVNDKLATDNLDTDLRNLGEAQPTVTANDLNNNGFADDTDRQAVSNAINLVNQKQREWDEAVRRADRGISAEDHQALTQAATAYNEALRAAKESLNRINGLSGSDIDSLKQQVNTLQAEKTAPAANDGTTIDIDGTPTAFPKDDIPDTVNHAKDKLTAAENAKRELELVKQGKNEPYSAADANAINEKVSAFNSALNVAKKAVDGARDTLPDDGDQLNSRLTQLGNEAQSVETKDKNANGHADTDDVKAVQDAIATLTERQNAWESAKNGVGRAISQSEKATLDEAANAFNQALDAANEALKRVANLPEESALKQRVADFGAKKQHATVNDEVVPQNGTYHTQPGTNDVPDSVDRARKALDGATFSKQSADSNIAIVNGLARSRGHNGDYSTYDGLNEAQAGYLNSSISEFNSNLRNAKNAIAEAVGKHEITEEELKEFNGRLKGLGDEYPLASVGYQDLNNNYTPDNIDQAKVRNLVSEAIKAESEFRALKDSIGKAVNSEEYEKLKALADSYNAKVNEAKALRDGFPEGNEIKVDMGKQLDRLPKERLDVPAINDTNNNDIPDDQEIRDKITSLESTEGRNQRGGSLSAKLEYNYYNPDKFALQSHGTGSYMMSLYPQGGRPEWQLAGGFNLSRSGTGRPTVHVNHNDPERTYLLKVSEHFGYEQRNPGVHDPLSLTTGNKNDSLIIGGNASGGQQRAERIHSINLGDGNNTMIVGFGKPDLHVGVVTEGENLGRTVARVGNEGWGNTPGVQDIKHDGYYTNGYDGYLAGFQSIRMGSGNDAFVVKQDVYRANINLGDGDNDVFVGGNFYAAELTTGSGNDHLEFTRIGDSATIQTGAGNDILTVHKIENDYMSVDLGTGDDTLVLKELGVIPTMRNHALKGNEGMDTIVMSVDQAHAYSSNGLTSKDFRGFEKIRFEKSGFVQISGQDLLDDPSMTLTEGKKVLRIDNVSTDGHRTTVNLGSNHYDNPNQAGSSPDLRDMQSNWRDEGTQHHDGKDYKVYSYSYGGNTAEVWLHGDIHIV